MVFTQGLYFVAGPLCEKLCTHSKGSNELAGVRTGAGQRENTGGVQSC